MQYVVIHIPKTAGTSVQAVLRDAFGPGEVSERFAAKPLTPDVASELAMHRVVLGHVSWTDVERFFAARSTITFLREPVDRCLSWYDFVLGQEPDPEVPTDPASFRNDAAQAIALAHRLPIDDFFDSRHPHVMQNVANRMVHQLAGHCVTERRDAETPELLESALGHLDAVDFVGLYERLDEDITRLRDFIGAPPSRHVPHLNRTTRRTRREAIAPSTLDRIRAINALDLRLYEHAECGMRNAE